MTAREPDKPSAQESAIAIESVAGRMIIARMIESLREQRLIAEDVAKKAVEEIERLEDGLSNVLNLIGKGQAKAALALMRLQRAEIDALFFVGKNVKS
jgi:hypothetical protein